MEFSGWTWAGMQARHPMPVAVPMTSSGQTPLYQTGGGRKKEGEGGRGEQEGRKGAGAGQGVPAYLPTLQWCSLVFAH